MKKALCLMLALVMIFSLAACGAKEWSREGTFADENGNYLSIVKSEDSEHPGWYVGCMIDEGAYGWYIKQKGKVLKGNLVADYLSEAPFNVTVSEEGEDGVLLTLENGTKYSFKPYEIPTATIAVNIKARGDGEVAYAKDGEEISFSSDIPNIAAYIGLAAPEVYTIAARPLEGNKFWKWTKNGEDFSFDLQMTIELDESADYVAIFGKEGTDETPVDLSGVKTLGELLGLPEYSSGAGGGKYIYVFEQDWIIYRATATLDEATFDALIAIDYSDPDRKTKEKDLIKDLPVVSIENISEKELKGDDLKALIGKTGKDLTDAGWSLEGWNLDTMVFDMGYDCFYYNVTFEGTVSGSDLDEASIADLVVKSVECRCLGNTADL